MILDKATLFADDLAYNGTPEVIDLGNTTPGPGKPLKVFIQGSSTLAGCDGFKLVDGTTSSPADDLLEITANPAGKTIEFDVPSECNRYLTIALVGTVTAGSFSAGIVLEGVQTAV